MTLIDKAEVLAILAPAPNAKDGLWAKRKQALYDAIAALPARGVGVKPLVWEPSAINKPWHSAKAPWGWYYAQWDDETQAWFASLEMGEIEAPIILSPSDVPTIDAAKAAAQADYAARILAALAPTDAAQDDDPECTDCGGTGITYQTERRCACQPTNAAHVNETPKSEHEAGNVLTDAAQAREAALLADIARGPMEGELMEPWINRMKGRAAAILRAMEGR